MTYAKFMLDEVVREQLMKMLFWLIGIQTQFTANPGKHGKYFSRYLSPVLWDMLENTYSDAGIDHTWDALEAMCNLFRESSTRVANEFGFAYPKSDDMKVSAHLKHVRSLPKDSLEVYESG
jgi:aminoglycoside 6-adenylyltransferase